MISSRSRAWPRAMLTYSLLCGLHYPAMTPAAPRATVPASTLPRTALGDLVIPAGTTAVIDQNIDVRRLNVQGALVCPATTQTLQVSAEEVSVGGAGALFECGTDANRFQGNLSIALKEGPVDSGSKRSFMVHNGGVLRLHGRKKNLHWVHLGQTAAAGATVIQLDTPTDWSVGDEIVIAPTSFEAKEAERRTITAVANAGQTLTLSSALTYKHYGDLQCLTGQNGRTWNLDERAEVANLNRNIKIFAAGDPNLMGNKGGHVMVMRGAAAYIDAVEFSHMGRMAEIMRYPFHWHRAGDVAGQYIKNSSVHDSWHRCITVHGTDNAWIENNLCYNHFGHGFFLEDGNETGNSFVRNLAIWSRKPPVGQEVLQSDNVEDGMRQRWQGPAAYWISNPDNVFVANVAAGSEGTGFWNSFALAKYCPPDGSDNCKLDNSANANVFPYRAPTRGFLSNVSHSSFIGFTWDGAEVIYRPANNPRNPEDHFIDQAHYRPPGIPILHGNRAHKNSTGIYVRGDTMQFQNSVFADNGSHLISVTTTAWWWEKARPSTPATYRQCSTVPVTGCPPRSPAYGFTTALSICRR